MKKIEIFFSAILVPIDFLMLLLAATSAYYIRVGSIVTEIKPVIYTLPFAEYLSFATLICLLMVVIFALAGMYTMRANRKISQEFGRIFFACSTGILGIIVAIFLQRELFSSRFIIIAAWILAIIYVTIGRLIVLKIQRIFLKQGVGAHKVIIIGNDKNTEAIINNIKNDPKGGYQIIKTYKSFNETVRQEIINLAEKDNADEILLADPNFDKDTVLSLIDLTEEFHLNFKYAADLFNTKASKVKIETIASIPIFEFQKTPLEGWGKVYKRIFDIVGAIILIILTSPITLITALLIKLDSRGPVIYKNERVGAKGRLFELYKFRYMKSEYSIGKQFENTEAALKYENQLIKKLDVRKGPLYKIKNDPRLTRVGAFIRKWSIDELPQFFNVLSGSMSLVGPRPHQPREVEKYQKHHKKVLDIKPGVTGLAQISGRSDLEFEDEVKLDTYYIENWSLAQDIKILWKTPKAVLFPKRKAL